MEKFGFTDLHTHCLPCVDDGSGSMDETMKMLDKSWSEGVTNIFFTPHFDGRSNRMTHSDISFLYDQVVLNAKELYPKLRIYLGNEVKFYSGIIDDIKDGLASTMAGTKYILVEFPFEESGENIFFGIKQIVEAGLRPILAHFERYSAIYRKDDKIDELIQLGASIQVNAETLTGGAFDATSKWCFKLISKEMIHFIGSDCHGIKQRPPLMRSAMEKIAKKAGDDAALRIAVINPEKLLRNDYIS